MAANVDLGQLLETAKLYRTITRWTLDDRNSDERRLTYYVEAEYTGASYSVRTAEHGYSLDVYHSLRISDGQGKTVLDNDGKSREYRRQRDALFGAVLALAGIETDKIQASDVHTAEAQAFAELWGSVWETDLPEYELAADPGWALPEGPTMDPAEWISAYPEVGTALRRQASPAAPSRSTALGPLEGNAAEPFSSPASAARVMPPDKFRQLWSFGAEPSPNKEGSVTVRGDHLDDALRAVSHAVWGEDPERTHAHLQAVKLEATNWHDPILGGAGAQYAPNGVAVVATDGSRMSVAIIPASKGEGVAWGTLLPKPRQILDEIRHNKATSSKNPKNVTLSGSGNWATVAVSDKGVQVATYPGNFPKWRDVLPQSGTERSSDAAPRVVISGVTGKELAALLTSILSDMDDKVDEVTAGKYTINSKQQIGKEHEPIFLPLVTLSFSLGEGYLIGHVHPYADNKLTEEQRDKFHSVLPVEKYNWQTTRNFGKATPENARQFYVALTLSFLLDAAEAIGDAPLEIRLYGTEDAVRIDATESWPIIHEIIMPRRERRVPKAEKPARRGKR